VIKADPVDYVNRYGSTLIHSRNLPQFVNEIPHPGYTLASDDDHAPEHIDLEEHALGNYRHSYKESVKSEFSTSELINNTRRRESFKSELKSTVKEDCYQVKANDGRQLCQRQIFIEKSSERVSATRLSDSGNLADLDMKACVPDPMSRIMRELDCRNRELDQRLRDYRQCARDVNSVRRQFCF